MALTLGPVAVNDSRTSSIIALVATDLLGSTKREVYSDSSSEMLQEAHRLVSYPDTKCFLYNTTSTGERTGQPFAMITRDTYYDLSEVDALGNGQGIGVCS